MFVLILLTSIISSLALWTYSSSSLNSGENLSMIVHHKSVTAEMQQQIKVIFKSPPHQVIIYNNNPTLACLNIPQSSCNSPDGNGGQAYRNVVYIPRMDDPTVPWYVFDAAGRNGLDINWQACNTFDAVNDPTNTCIYRPTVVWRSTCAVGSGCLGQPYELKIWIDISPSTGESINALRGVRYFTIN